MNHSKKIVPSISLHGGLHMPFVEAQKVWATVLTNADPDGMHRYDERDSAD